MLSWFDLDESGRGGAPTACVESFSDSIPRYPTEHQPQTILPSSVEYKHLATGYELNVARGWVGQPALAYPKEFWQGLGLAKSNLKPGAWPAFHP